MSEPDRMTAREARETVRGHEASIKRIVAEAPPLNSEQIDLLRRLLLPTD